MKVLQGRRFLFKFCLEGLNLFLVKISRWTVVDGLVHPHEELGPNLDLPNDLLLHPDVVVAVTAEQGAI